MIDIVIKYVVCFFIIISYITSGCRKQKLKDSEIYLPSLVVDFKGTSSLLIMVMAKECFWNMCIEGLNIVVNHLLVASLQECSWNIMRSVNITPPTKHAERIQIPSKHN